MFATALNVEILLTDHKPNVIAGLRCAPENAPTVTVNNATVPPAANAANNGNDVRPTIV